MTVSEYTGLNLVSWILDLILTVGGLEGHNQSIYAILALSIVHIPVHIYYLDKFKGNFLSRSINTRLRASLCFILDHKDKRTKFDSSGEKRKSGVECQRCGREKFDREEN